MTAAELKAYDAGHAIGWAQGEAEGSAAGYRSGHADGQLVGQANLILKLQTQLDRHIREACEADRRSKLSPSPIGD